MALVYHHDRFWNWLVSLRIHIVSREHVSSTTVFWDKCLAWLRYKDNAVDAEVGNVNEDKLPAEVTPLISIEDPKNI